MTDLQALVDQELRHAWAAGVLDAYGRWLVLTRSTRLFNPRIIVPARKDNPMIAQLVDTFGGSVGKPKGGKHQRQWQVTGAKACLAVNDAVLPYLTRTQPMSRAHLHLCRRIVEFKPASFQDRVLPAEEVTFRRELMVAFEGARARVTGVVVPRIP